jgi:hypothetical protein
VVCAWKVFGSPACDMINFVEGELWVPDFLCHVPSSPLSLIFWNLLEASLNQSSMLN